MSSGGGGQSGQTRYDWNPVMSGYWGGAPDSTGRNGGGVLGWASDVAMTPYQNYGGARIASQNNDVWTGQQRVRNMADSGGPSDTAAARQAAGNIASGGALDANPFMGQNPFFTTGLQNALADVTNAYQQGTAADTTRAFNLSGAFGSSAHANAVDKNQNALARNLSRVANEAFQQQYDRSANMYEGALGRQMQAIPLGFQGQQLSNDMNDRLMGVGQQNMDYTQRYLDQNYNDWTQANNWSRNNIGWLAQLLGGAQGSTGLSTQFGGYQPTNYGSQALGAGLLARAGGLI